jgi:hypothetical protein
MARPIEFPEQNVVWGKDQPPYKPLPAYTDEMGTVSLWELTWRERLRVLFTGKVWLQQMHFGGPLQPQALGCSSPFEKLAHLKATKEDRDV